MLTLDSLEMRAEAPSAAAEILLLSDNDRDIRLVKGAANSSHVNVVPECPDVLAFLRHELSFRDSPRPDLILLDLDLSNPEHCDTLQGIKQDESLRRIPVIVMAASDSPDKIQGAYDLHANAYVLKPTDPEDFVKVINTTLTFWLKLARLPKD